jgi:transcriptional regulator
MYIPDYFREERLEVLWAFVAKHPLGALVVVTADGITANHIPMIWQARGDTPGVLHGHVARANPLWETVVPGASVLAIFSGANRYITPSWYPANPCGASVVPTWNYSVVHAHGTIRFFEDRDQSLRHVSELADRQEALRAEPWKVSDAPADFIDPMLSRIVLFEIAVTRAIGKFKANQQRPESERLAVAAAMAAEDIPVAEREELIRLPEKQLRDH